MATPIRIKRSAVSGKKPQNIDLQVGELALNTYDGSLFTKRDTGGVGIATTVSNITPWVENYGSTSINYSGGNVGINSNIPSSLLDVRGVVTATTFSGSGANLSSIPNSALDNSSVNYGGVSLALGTSDTTPAFNLSDATNYPYTSLTGIVTHIVGDTTPQLGGDLDGNSKSIYGVGVITATSFSGSGANLTALNASNLGSGTVPDARFPATLPAKSGVNLTSLNATNLGSGTIPDSRFPSTLPAIDGSNLTGITAVTADGLSGSPNINVSNIVGTALSVSGISTFAGITTITGDTLFAKQLNVSGVSTFSGTNFEVLTTGENLVKRTGGGGNANVLIVSGDQNGQHLFKLRHGGTGIGEIKKIGTNGISLRSNTLALRSSNSDESYLEAEKDGAVELYYDDVKRFSTSGVGATVHGQLDTTNLTIDSGTLKVGTAITASGGIITATTFKGALEGNVTGTLQTASQPNITSVGTLSSLDVNGDVGIGGTLTYEDVTNIDSIGIVTAQQGIHVSTGGINAVGVVTGTSFKSTVSTGTAPFVVASQTRVDNLNADLLDGRDTSNTGGNEVVMVTNASGGTSLGSGTFTAGTLKVGTAITAHAGVITATSFVGSGASLTGLTGASANTYGNSTNTPVITVDGNGRITTISTASISGGGGNVAGINTTGTSVFNTLDIGGDIDVDGHTELDNLSVSGITTFGNSDQATIDAAGNFTTSGEIKVSNAQPGMVFEDTGANPDFIIQNRDGSFAIRDTTNAANRFLVNMANGDVTVTGDITGDNATNITGIGSVGIGTNNPDGQLHISSGNSGDCRVYIEADADNNAEGDNPFIIFKNDGGIENASVWCGNTDGGTNDNSLNLSASTSVNGGIRFFTGDTDGDWETADERVRITPDGELLINAVTERSYVDGAGYTQTPKLQVESNSNVDTAISLRYNSGAGAAGRRASFIFARTADGTAVSNNSVLGEVLFMGEGNSTLEKAASIRAEVDGTPGTNDMPGRLIFSTSDDGSDSPTERLRIASDGKVGIGTNDPTAHLQVYRKTAFAGNPIIQARSNNGSTNELKFEIDGDGDAYFNGNVGIGTAAPDEVLHVLQRSTSAAEFKLENNEGYLLLRTDNNVATYGAQQHLFHNRANSTEYLRITSSGNVSIGTATAEARLQVDGSGSTNTLNFLTRDVNDNNVFWIKDNGTAGLHYFPFVINQDNDDTATPSGTYFYVHHSSSPFIIKNDGKVGVGITTPQGDLQVGTGVTIYGNSGIVSATTFKGNATSATTATLSLFSFMTNNNTTDETVFPVFVDGTTSSEQLEVDSGFMYNPSTGILTATVFSGNLAGTVNTAAQPNITSLGTLSSLGVTGDVSIGGTLTYEDVTNIDAIGIITARSGILVSAGSSVGIGTVPASGTTLDIDASGGGVLALRRNSVSTNNKITLSSDGTDGTLDSTNDIIFRAGGSEAFRVNADQDIILKRASIAPIHRSDTAGGVYIAGGNDTNVGGNINLFGSTHASHANHIRLRNGETVAVEIDDNGKVGVGSVTPGATLDLQSSDTEALLRLHTKPTKNGYLDIVSDTNRRGVIRFQDTGGTSRWSIGNGDSDELSNTSFHISSGSSGGGAAKLVINSSGDVGIGTTNPSKDFEVYRNGLVNAKIKGNVAGGLGAELILQNANTAANGYSEIQFQDAGTNVFSKIRGFNLTDGSNNGYMALYTASATEGLKERVRISDAGKVGIGTDLTTTPSSVLTVAPHTTGGRNISLYTSGSVGNKAGLFFNATPATGNLAEIQAEYKGTNQGELVLSTSMQKRLTINKDGEVGIGTDDPQKKLEVYDGDIYLNSTDKKIFLTSDFDQYITANASSNYLVLGTANDERLRIDSNGNVGLNTIPATSGTLYSTVDHFLVIGDNDTGIAQDGDGQLEIWANNQEIINFSTAGLDPKKSILPAQSINIAQASLPISHTYSTNITLDTSLIHNGDTDTYLNFGANQINLHAGGTTGITVFDTNVRIPTALGINGATPQSPLDVIANASGYAVDIRGRSSDDTSEIHFCGNNSSPNYAAVGVTTTGGGQFNLSVAGSQRVGIASDGQTTVKSTNNSPLVLNNTNSNGQSSISFQSAGSTKYNLGSNKDGDGNIDFFIFDQINSAHRFNIKADGNTGIGTDNPKTLLDVRGSISMFDALAAPYGGTVSYTVTVTDKVNHRYQGQGSDQAYYIDGIESPVLTLTPGRTYRFNNTNTGSHPLKFYCEADKTTLYESGVNFQNTYTEITVSESTPSVLYYQCTNHVLMGNAVITNSEGLFHVGVTTFSGDVVFSGAGSTITFDKSTDDLIFNDGAKAKFGTDLSKELEIFFDGTHSKIDHTSTTGSLFLAGDSLVLSNSGMSEYYLQAAEDGAVSIGYSGSTKLATTSTGVVVTGILTATSFVKSGGTSSQYLMADGSVTTSGGGGGVTIKDEGSALSTAATTLDFVGSGVTVSGSGAEKTVTIAGGAGQDVFKTISVAGQDDVVADSATDTLTLAAGGNMTITTNATSDTITFTSSGGGGGTGGKFVENATGIHTLGNVGVGTTNASGAILNISTGAGVTDTVALDIQGTEGSLFSVTNNLTSGSLFSINDVSGIPAFDYNSNGNISMGAFADTIAIGKTSSGVKLGVKGSITEGVHIVANKLSAAPNINVDNGNVHYFSTNETTTATPNITSTVGLNTALDTGDTLTVAIIYKPNGAGYYAQLTIDGVAQTEEWLGGSAPSSGGAGGYDVNTYNIIKTGDAAYIVLANNVNFA